MNDKAKKVIVLTGAAGKVGKRLYSLLRDNLLIRCTDLLPMNPSDPDDPTLICDLADFASVSTCFEGAEAVVHLAAIPRDAPIEDITRSNLLATYNVYEACRVHGIKRVVFGSSNHVVGFYGVEQQLNTAAPFRPDGLYGASKVFGEGLASLYWDKHGIESVCIRIGSVLDRPTQPRHLSTWISHADLAELIRCSLYAPRVGLTTVFGVSKTSRMWWDNRAASHLGFVPSDSADDYAENILADADEIDIFAPEHAFQGGKWAAEGYDK